MGPAMKAIANAVEQLRTKNFDFPPLTFFCGGTGFPDDVCLDYWKDTNVIVVTRDGKRYYRGELMEDDRK